MQEKKTSKLLRELQTFSQTAVTAELTVWLMVDCPKENTFLVNLDGRLYWNPRPGWWRRDLKAITFHSSINPGWQDSRGSAKKNCRKIPTSRCTELDAVLAAKAAWVDKWKKVQVVCECASVMIQIFLFAKLNSVFALSFGVTQLKVEIYSNEYITIKHKSPIK